MAVAGAVAARSLSCALYGISAVKQGMATGSVVAAITNRAMVAALLNGTIYEDLACTSQ